jgi:hypothetical protein
VRSGFWEKKREKQKSNRFAKKCVAVFGKRSAKNKNQTASPKSALFLGRALTAKTATHFLLMRLGGFWIKEAF